MSDYDVKKVSPRPWTEDVGAAGTLADPIIIRDATGKIVSCNGFEKAMNVGTGLFRPEDRMHVRHCVNMHEALEEENKNLQFALSEISKIGKRYNSSNPLHKGWGEVKRLAAVALED